VTHTRTPTGIVDSPNDQHLSVPIQSPQREKAGDSSGPLFTIYSNIAEDEDKKMAESWKKDADGIIIFVRQGAVSTYY
jgi:hypothetical protein